MSTSTSKPIVSECNIKNLLFFGRIKINENSSLLLLRRNKAFFVIQNFVENPEYGVRYLGHENDKFYEDFSEFCVSRMLKFKIQQYETQ